MTSATTKQLNEVADLKDSLHQTPEYVEDGYPMVRVTDIRRGFLNLSDTKRVSRNTFSEFTKRYAPQVGDTLFSRVGSYGNSCFIDESAQFCLGQNTVCISPRVEHIDPFFLYSCLNSAYLRNQIDSLVGGASQPTISLKSIGTLQLPYLEMAVQKRIGSILYCYDSLIETNTQRIKILEKMTQMLYREWFVNFRFPGHEKVKMVQSEIMGLIPEGWTASVLGNLCEEVRRSVNPSDVPAETPYIGLEHMPRKSIALSDWGEAGQVQSTKLRFRRGEILFGKIRPYFHKVGVAPVDGVCSSDAIVIVPKGAEHFPVVLLCVSSDDFVLQATQTSQGTKMPRANWDVLSRYPVALPPKNLLNGFGAAIVPMVELLIRP
jgi:type I restriction enzyme S subunit